MVHRISSTRPYPGTFGPDFLGLGLACLSVTYTFGQMEWEAIGFIAISGILLAAYRIYQLSLSEPHEILSNVFLTFTVSFTLYFLLGPLMQVFGSINDIEKSRNFFDITANDAAIVLGANLVGFGIALTVGRIIQFKSFTHFTIRFTSQLYIVQFSRIEVFLIAAGLFFKLYVLYNDLFINDTISGLYRTAQLLCPAGVFLYFKESSLNIKPRCIFVMSAVVIYSFGGLLEFNKTEIFVPVVAMIGGIQVRSFSLIRLSISLAFIGIALEILQPVNLDARNEVLSRIRPTIAERIDIYENAFRGDYITTIDARDGIWNRFDYTAPDIAAMWLYDNGNGGNSYQLIPWLFVPRFLYPDKPEVTTAGTIFTEKIQGYNTSSTGQGIFISGYYDLGWFGLIFVSILSGVTLAWYRAVIVCAQISKSTALLILGMLGHWLAFYISGDYLASYLGSWITSMYAFVLLLIIQKIIYGRNMGV